MIITNTPKFGGDLGSELINTIMRQDTDRLRMVSGYIGEETINALENSLPRIGHVAIELVVGMAAREGLGESAYKSLLSLNEVLIARSHPTHSRQGVFAYFSGKDGSRSRGMHAKAYLFDCNGNKKLIVGSSNYSRSGLQPNGNVEMNVVEINTPSCLEFEHFFENLHIEKNTVRLDLIRDFPIKGKAVASRKTISGLTRIMKPTGYKTFDFVDIDLARNIEKQTGSNLNCCFGKGRETKKTGEIKVRTWYEIEIISDLTTTKNPQYPKGDFLATTSDGFQFEATTNGDYYKNLRSKGDLKTFGIWLKGRLEDAGALNDDPQEMVTLDTFKKYGNSILRIYRPDKNSAILHFPQDKVEL
jgi:hypothetical protein